MNNGPFIALRDRAVKKTGSYDLLTEAGKVKPKALDPYTYRGTHNWKTCGLLSVFDQAKAPNGASMRPNTIKQSNLVKKSIGSNVVIYAVPPGEYLQKCWSWIVLIL